jgi:SAM-dependent methyltransferase
MRRPEFIARQARRPSGLLGRVLGHVMASETAGENAMALKLLELQSDDQVLEIGFGPGRTLARVAELIPGGFVAGVDPSEEMLRLATSHNRHFIAQEKMELKLGNTTRIPYDDGRFDKVYSVHTIYFWPEPARDLQEIRRVLKGRRTLSPGISSQRRESISRLPRHDLPLLHAGRSANTSPKRWLQADPDRHRSVLVKGYSVCCRVQS